MFSQLRLIKVASAASLSLFLANSMALPAAHADIVWGAAQNMVGAGDIATNGTFVDATQAGNVTNPVSVTSNNVTTTFSGLSYAANPSSPPGAVATSSLGYITITADDPFGPANPNYSTGVNNPFVASPVNSNYSTVVSSGVYDNGEPGSVTLNNLSAGHVYQIEVWNYYVGSGTSAFDTTLSGATPVTLNSGIGQFSLGTFTVAAGGSSQSFTYSTAAGTSGPPLINAVELRDITATPEPASLALFGLSAAGLLLLKRRKTA